MTRTVNVSSLTYARMTPETTDFESSIDVGWSSLLATHGLVGDTCKEFESPLVADQMVTMITGGAGRIDSLHCGRWQSDPFEVGTTYLVGPGERWRHRWWASSTGVPTGRIQIFIPSVLLAEAVDLFVRPNCPRPSHSIFALALRDGALEQVCFDLLHAMRKGLPDIYCEAVAQWLAVHLLALGTGVLSSSLPHRSRRGRLARAVEYIDYHHPDQIQLNSLAKEAGVSKFHFARQYKTPVSQIGYDCGFPNAAHFTESFSRRFGQTPRQFRERSRSSRA